MVFDFNQHYTVKTSIVTAINAVIARIPSFPACCKSVSPPLRFRVGDGAGVVSSESVTVGGAGGLFTVGAGAGA